MISYAAATGGSVTSVHASIALFQSAFISVIVARSPMMIKPNRARVHMTFSRLGSSTNPISRVTLHRTVENTTTSLSRPWNESIVAHVTDDGRALFKREICFAYGDSAAMVSLAGGASLAVAGPAALEGGWRRATMRAASSTWPSLPLDADPVVSSVPHCTKTVGTSRCSMPTLGHGNAVVASRARTGALSRM